MTDNWLRTTTLTIGDILIDQLDIEFTISQDTEATGSAAATIKIYNLAPATIAQITPGDRTLLTAGYLGDSGIIYLGQIADITTKTDGADTRTELTCTDYTWPANLRSRTYPRGTPVGTIIRTLYADAAIPAGAIITDLGVTTTDTYTTDPNSKTTLDQLIRMINGDPDIRRKNLTVHHTILGGESCVIAANQTTSDLHLLSSETGLLATSPDTAKTGGLTATLLLNWRIRPDSLCRIQNASGEGWYKVTSARHSADTNTYQTELKLTSMETTP